MLSSCSTSEKNNNEELKALAEMHVAEMKVRPLIDEFLLSVGNDTCKVCFALVLPKQALIRLTRGETFPTQGGLNKIREILVRRYTDGMEYIDSCAMDKASDKDWLIQNSSNEAILPLWEQLVE